MTLLKSAEACAADSEGAWLLVWVFSLATGVEDLEVPSWPMKVMTIIPIRTVAILCFPIKSNKVSNVPGVVLSIVVMITDDKSIFYPHFNTVHEILKSEPI